MRSRGDSPTTSGSPLIFGEAVNFGVTANVGPDSQGFDFTLGYKDKNLAIVPVAIVTDDKVRKILSHHTKCTKRHDALSVFGQFTSQGNWSMLSTEQEKNRAITLDQINEGFDRLDSGEAVRQVIIF